MSEERTTEALVRSSKTPDKGGVKPDQNVRRPLWGHDTGQPRRLRFLRVERCFALERLGLGRRHVSAVDGGRRGGRSGCACRLLSNPRSNGTSSSEIRYSIFDIRKIFADDKNVCVLYDITVSGIMLFACGWFQLEAGTVRSMRVTFDPRPLLGTADPE